MKRNRSSSLLEKGQQQQWKFSNNRKGWETARFSWGKLKQQAKWPGKNDILSLNKSISTSWNSSQTSINFKTLSLNTRLLMTYMLRADRLISELYLLSLAPNTCCITFHTAKSSGVNRISYYISKWSRYIQTNSWSAVLLTRQRQVELQRQK